MAGGANQATATADNPKGVGTRHNAVARYHDDRRLWLTATCAVVLLGIVVRALVDFSQPYPPGTDAGYYPMQTGALLAKGRLMYDDLPLVFWLDAAIAKLFILRGWQLDDAVLIASRVLNCLTQPFVAVSVMALGYSWSAGRRQALPGCAAAALMVVVSTPTIQLVGFHKTSLGLVWMAWALWACRSAMQDGGAWRWALLAAVAVLSALTHVGVFAVTILTLGVALGLWQWLKRDHLTSRRPWLMVGSLMAACSALAGLVAYLEPRRARAILEAPVVFFATGIFGVGFFLDRTGWLLATSVLVVLAFGLRRLLRDYAAVGAADAAVVAAAVVISVFLVLPKNVAYLYRLLLMAPLPAAFIVAFIMARRAVRESSKSAGYLLLGLAVVIALVVPATVPPAVIGEQAGRELRALQAQVTDPDATLVVAPHGLEWFAGYFLHTPVRMSGYGPLRRADLPADVFRRYRRVLLVRFRSRTPVGVGSAGLTMRRIHLGVAFEAFEVSQPPAL